MTRQSLAAETADGRKGRISPQLKHAIELMVVDGLKRADAAQAAGMTDNGLYAALKRSHVRAFRRERETAYLQRCGMQGVRTAEHLRENAKSEHVKLDAAKWLAAFNEQVRSQRGDESGANSLTVNGNDVRIQVIQAQQPQSGWRPPQGAQVPDHLIPDQEVEPKNVTPNKDLDEPSDSE